MEDRSGQFDVSKVTGTLLHVLVARSAFKAAIDGAHARVAKSIFPWKLLLLILF